MRRGILCLIRGIGGAAGKRCYHTPQTKQKITMRQIDVRSDTLTQPSAAMRKAMAEAVVGDDVYKEDPTVNDDAVTMTHLVRTEFIQNSVGRLPFRAIPPLESFSTFHDMVYKDTFRIVNTQYLRELETKVATLLGKEAALFVPSGTMGNLIAMMAHCDRRGMEVLIGDRSHIFCYEQGGVAQLGGIHPSPLHTNPDGTFEFEELVKKVRSFDRLHEPDTGLICIENTHNRCGGTALPLEFLDRLGAVKRQLGIPVHLDGARLFNAAIYHNVSVAILARYCDSVNICLSKGLGAPVGSMVAGTKGFIAKAIRLRKALGGGMRQAGVLAAAGIYALDNMVDRLKDDHKRTLYIAKAIEATGSSDVTVKMPLVHTNILMVYLRCGYMSAKRFCERMEMVTPEEEAALKTSFIVKMKPIAPYVIRLVLHADLSEDDVNYIVKKFEYIISEPPSNK